MTPDTRSTSTQHTPGPWHVDPELDYAIRAKGELSCLSSGEKIAQLQGFRLNAEANARLIAAAPALLEALREVLRTSSRPMPMIGETDEGYAGANLAYDAAVTQATEVLAQATGEAAV